MYLIDGAWRESQLDWCSSEVTCVSRPFLLVSSCACVFLPDKLVMPHCIQVLCRSKCVLGYSQLTGIPVHMASQVVDV